MVSQNENCDQGSSHNKAQRRGKREKEEERSNKPERQQQERRAQAAASVTASSPTGRGGGGSIQCSFFQASSCPDPSFSPSSKFWDEEIGKSEEEKVRLFEHL